MRFNVASDEEIKRGGTTDIYFVRTMEVLRAKGLEGTRVVAEVTAGSLPNGWSWGVLCGIDELVHLFEGVKVNVYALPEGTIFTPVDIRGVRMPVVVIEGPYGEFCELETPLLGVLCHATGVSTAAARIRKLVPDKLLLSFGIRRMHPAISPMIDRAAYIGGFDGVSAISGARIIGKEPMGTMPHSLIILFGDQVKAWKAFDEVIPKNVPRVALVDTYFDEKVEAVMAAEALGKRLWGVRLDTPPSRKGDFPEIVREVRWELDRRGYENVKIIVSGGIGEREVSALAEAGADGFGVGSWLSNAPTVNFAMDIVEMNGKPVAKRGKFGCKKEVWRCKRCMSYLITRSRTICPRCGGAMRTAMTQLIKNGKIVGGIDPVDEVRKRVLSQIKRLDLSPPK
ncbi:MAG: nicotinate phosphoribosyltransferase [Candidatus Hadarchaeales archaeon]